MPREQPSTDRERFAQTLRSSALRVTATRLAVMRALEARPHADAETVIGLVRGDLGSVSPQTVYNVLADLVTAQIIRRVEPAGSPALHELRVGDNHHHVVCRRCGSTADIDCAVGERPCLTPSESHGYLLDEAEVTFWGLCPQCQPQTGRAVVEKVGHHPDNLNRPMGAFPGSREGQAREGQAREGQAREGQEGQGAQQR